MSFAKRHVFPQGPLRFDPGSPPIIRPLAAAVLVPSDLDGLETCVFWTKQRSDNPC